MTLGRLAAVCAIVVGSAALLVGGVIVINYKSYVRTQHKLAGKAVQDLAAIVRQFRADNRRCPTLDELTSQKYVAKRANLDPWGTALIFDCLPANDVVARSAGRDRQFNTYDDITRHGK